MTTPIIPFVDIETLAADQRAMLERQAEKFGMVHNSMLTYLHRPALAGV